MDSPKLELHINQNSELCVLSITPERAEHVVVQLPLGNLLQDRTDSAGALLGEAILGHLRLLYPEEFKSFPRTVATDTHEFSDYMIAQRLLHKSVSEKTRVFTQAIDRLIRAAAASDPDAKTFLNEGWPVVLARLEEFPS